MNWLNEPSDQYHAHKALGSGNIRDVLENPAYFHAKRSLPQWMWEKDDTPALEFGRLLHMRLWEPDEYKRCVVVRRFWENHAMAAPKAELRELEASIEPHQIIVTYKDNWIIEQMVASAYAVPEIRNLLERPGFSEQSGYAVDPDTGTMIKVRPDRAIPELGWIVDSKTCRDISPYGVRKAMLESMLHVQAAHYLETANLVETQPTYERFVFLFMFKAPPYTCALWVPDMETMRIGKHLRAKGLHTYRNCIESGVWPDTQAGVFDLSLPEYARNV